jgi:hypothetical protein
MMKGKGPMMASEDENLPPWLKKSAKKGKKVVKKGKKSPKKGGKGC